MMVITAMHNEQMEFHNKYYAVLKNTHMACIYRQQETKTKHDRKFGYGPPDSAN